MTQRRRRFKAVRKDGIYLASKAARDLFQNIVSAMSDGILVINREGEIIRTNAALAAILGIDQAEMVGKGWADLFFGRPENDRFNDVVVDVIQNQVCHYNQQVVYYTPAGQARELIVTTNLLSAPERAEPEVRGVLVVFKDVSELMALTRREQELSERSRRLYQEKLEGLDRLARAVAHEIRNPVMSIGGLTQRLLARCEPGNPDCRYYQRILDGSRRLESIVAQVREYADLGQPRPVAADLGVWLDGLAADYRAKAETARVRLVWPAGMPPGQDPPEVVASFDPKLLGRALRVMLDNALDAMPQGGDLFLGLGRQLEPPLATIHLADTGRGIPPEDLPYLFDPFFTTKADGVGMDLALAKRIVDEHNGEIRVESRPQRGTTFRVSLPLAQPPQPVMTKP
ncbi:MAG: two-component system sensor histidine kinase NtrB [Thermodesulfobacteriota bacterium]